MIVEKNEERISDQTRTVFRAIRGYFEKVQSVTEMVASYKGSLA
jgi:hypothetical protein